MSDKQSLVLDGDIPDSKTLTTLSQVLGQLATMSDTIKVVPERTTMVRINPTVNLTSISSGFGLEITYTKKDSITFEFSKK